MRNISTLIFTFLVVSKISVAQVYTWTGSVSTDYQVADNWSPARTTPAVTDTLSFNAVSAISVSNVANQTIGAIWIASGTNSVTFSSNVPSYVLRLSAVQPLIYTSAGRVLAGDFITIEIAGTSTFTLSTGFLGIAPGHGGKIRINGALTLAGGTLDFDVAGTGGATINAPGSITYVSGTFSSARTASITWTTGANYYHKTDGASASAIPSATWQTGSICNITGMNAGTIAPTGFVGVNFANITWNCPQQNNSITLLPAGTTVNLNGTFTIASTGTGAKELRLSTGKATIKAGGYAQTGGNLTLQYGADTTLLGILDNFSHTGGSLNGVGGTSAGTALIDLKGNVTFGGTASWQSTSTNAGSQATYQFSGTRPQIVNVSLGIWNAPAAGRCNIVVSNTETSNGVNLTGQLKVINTSNTVLPATLAMGGVFTGTGSVAYSGAGTGGTTLVYNGNFFQTVSGIEFPVSAAPLNLSINNSLGASFPINFNRALAGRLSLLAGNLAIGNGDTLSLTNTTLANQLTYTAGFITTGTLGRYFPVTGLPTAPGVTSLFPFGSGANSRLLNIYFSAASLNRGTAGMIFVSHSSLVDATPISLADNNVNPITLNKRSNTNWRIGTGSFILGGETTVSITAAGANIGSVNDYTYLRLTDGVTPNFGRAITTTGSNAIPLVGKSGLLQGDLNKTLYVGSDSHNPLIIITFTWTGLGGNTNWTTPGNWTGGVGYPSASTERAVISGTSGTLPSINAGTNIDIYQLIVNPGMTLTMTGTAILNVFDTVNFGGTAVFAPTSTFTYASSMNDQNVRDLPYGGFGVSGTAQKILPPVLKITGAYTISGAPPDITTNSNTFIYAGAGAQTILPANYYNLSITGNRGGQIITLGSQAQNTIDVKNVFDASTLINDSIVAGGNIFNYSSSGMQTIAGFYYNNITNSGNGPRTLDPLGHADPAHVITARTFDRGTGAYTIINSKINLYVSGTRNTGYGSASYYDLTISGNLKNFILEHLEGSVVSIAGTFNCTVTNFREGFNNFQIFLNGTGDQILLGFKSDTATNTPAFRYKNISIAGGSRNVTLTSADTISITGNLSPETTSNGVASTFAAGKGFIVTGSTVEFGDGGSGIPLLKPLVTGGNNYNNLLISSGSRIIGSNMIIGGDLTVRGTDLSVPAILNIGSGLTVKVNGNLSVDPLQ